MCLAGCCQVPGLNPAGIEFNEILKDAGVTAIYGWRGANGAIMIATKKEKRAGAV